MKLQILVPQYKESDSEVKPLLDSLAIQQNANFFDIGVIICNDGTDVRLSDYFLNSYPFEIQYHLLPHGGVSATRQACLDRATAEYVMFCDADDMFYNACGLWIIFREMAGNGFDTLSSVFIEESRIPSTNEIAYINHECDSTFVHGKVHRRQYLIDKNIRWNPNLTVHEDSYFNLLCQDCLDNVERGKYCTSPFYLWKWRSDSVCRCDEKYILKTYNNLFDSNTALIHEYLNRGMNEQAKMRCTSMIFDTYYTMNKDEWLDAENKIYRTSTESRFREYYQEFGELFQSTNITARNAISSGIRNRMVAEGMALERVTFQTWLDEIMGK